MIMIIIKSGENSNFFFAKTLAPSSDENDSEIWICNFCEFFFWKLKLSHLLIDFNRKKRYHHFIFFFAKLYEFSKERNQTNYKSRARGTRVVKRDLWKFLLIRFGNGNLIFESWNCFICGRRHWLAAISSTLMIWIESARARWRAPISRSIFILLIEKSFNKIKIYLNILKM